jgi:outer membrane protein assembly factor BamB
LPRLFGRWSRRAEPAGSESAPFPHEEKLLSSPLALGLLATLAALVLLGVTIYTVLVRTMANRLYNHAVEALDNGDYLNSIRDFDSFMESNPDDARVGKARVLRGLANVRQYVSPGGSMWTNALEAGKEMFETLQDQPEFRDERSELGELIIRIGEGLADRARNGADRKALAEAESTIPLHARITGEAAKALLGRSGLPGKLGDARAAIRKAEIRAAALSAMDDALRAGSSKQVYSARDGLIRQYGDLANDRDLVQRMVAANELVRRAVKVSSERRPAESQPRPEPLGPPTGMVLRTSTAAPSASPVIEEIVFAQADGFAYGLEGATGAPLWQRPVGLSSPFPPRRIPGDPSCLAVDARHHDLLRLDASTGDVIWRQYLGEPVDDPPLVLGNQLFQVLPSGKLLVLALDSGEVRSTVETGFPLSRSPIADEAGRNLYLLARRDCLLVLTRDPLACASVEYLGHAEGSIPSPPSRLGRFLIVPENHALNEGRWRVFVLDPESARVKPVQEVPIAGWTWSPPPVSSSIVWSASDRGVIEAFAAGDYGGVKPFKPVGRLDGDFPENGPVYAVARSDRELWVSSSHSGRYDLEAERGRLGVRFGLGRTGAAVGAIQPSGRLLVMSFRDPLTSGTAAWAVDPDTGATPWRTIVGAPWLTPPRRAGDGDDPILSTIGMNGRPVTIARSLLDSGGILGLPIPGSGEFSLPLERYTPLDVGGRTVLAPPVGSRFIWARRTREDGASSWRKVDLPSPIAATPLAWGGGLLVPAADSRIYVVDPDSSRSILEPFVPVYDRDRQAGWIAPAAADPENLIVADTEGRLRRLALRGARLVAEAETTLGQKPVADPVASPQTVIIATADQKVRALAARDLSPVGSWPCKGPISRLPRLTGGRFFIPDQSGGLLALGADGSRRWAIELGAGIVGDPLVIGRSVWFLTSDGTLHGRDLETGEPRSRIELHVLPAAGPMASATADEVIIPVARGTLQTFRCPTPEDRKP